MSFQVDLASDKVYKAEVLDTPGTLQVVELYQSWCGPCKAIISTFKAAYFSAGDKPLKFYTLNVDKVPGFEQYRGKSEPNFLFYRDGRQLQRVEGVRAPILTKLISSLSEGSGPIKPPPMAKSLAPSAPSPAEVHELPVVAPPPPLPLPPPPVPVEKSPVDTHQDAELVPVPPLQEQMSSVAPHTPALAPMPHAEGSQPTAAAHDGAVAASTKHHDRHHMAAEEDSAAADVAADHLASDLAAAASHGTHGTHPDTAGGALTAAAATPAISTSLGHTNGELGSGASVGALLAVAANAAAHHMGEGGQAAEPEAGVPAEADHAEGAAEQESDTDATATDAEPVVPEAAPGAEAELAAESEPTEAYAVDAGELEPAAEAEPSGAEAVPAEEPAEPTEPEVSTAELADTEPKGAEGMDGGVVAPVEPDVAESHAEQPEQAAGPGPAADLEAETSLAAPNEAVEAEAAADPAAMGGEAGSAELEAHELQAGVVGEQEAHLEDAHEPLDLPAEQSAAAASANEAAEADVSEPVVDGEVAAQTQASEMPHAAEAGPEVTADANIAGEPTNSDEAAAASEWAADEAAAEGAESVAEPEEGVVEIEPVAENAEEPAVHAAQEVEPEAELDAKAEQSQQAEPEPEAGPEAKPEPVPESGAELEGEAEMKPEAEPEAEPEAKPEADAEDE